MKNLLLAASVAIFLPGCFATYSFEKTADSCAVDIISTRDIEAGSISVDKDCALNAGAKGLTGEQARALLQALIR